MLWNEFQEGTGCRDNEYNYNLYKDLEVIYMKYDGMKKEDVYKIGKKLADNSPSEEEIKLQQEIDMKKESLLQEIADCEMRIGTEKSFLTLETSADMKNIRRDAIRYWQDKKKSCRAELKTLQYFFA